MGESRGYHYIRPQGGTWAPSHVVAVAADHQEVAGPAGGKYRHRVLARWIAESHTLLRGTLIDSHLGRGNTQQEWWDWLWSQCSRRCVTWVVCDSAHTTLVLLGLWRILSGRDCEVERLVLSDPPTIIRLRLGGRRCVLVDTANYLRDPVGDQHDAARAVPQLSHWITRILSWWHAEDLGRWQATSSGLAWSCWRRRHMTDRVLIGPVGEETADARSAYYPGRVQPFRLGRVLGPVHHLDANSLYPWAMREDQYPVRHTDTLTDPTPAALRARMRDSLATASVSIRAIDQEYPCRISGQVRYCIGQYRTWLAGAELERALDSGSVLYVHRAHLYDPAPIMRSYVTHLYGERVAAEQRGDPHVATLAKQMLNSLAGKWAERRHRWVDAPEIEPHQHYGEWWQQRPGAERATYCRAIAGTVQRQQGTGETDNSYPAIAAMITARSREHMRIYWQGRMASEVYYHDTDSLHISGDALAALTAAGQIDPHRLGALRLVETGDDAYYWGPRRYRIGPRLVVAGLSALAIADPAGTWRQESAERLPAQVRHGTPGTVTVKEDTYRLDRTAFPYETGDDGIVRPLMVGMEET